MHFSAGQDVTLKNTALDALSLDSLQAWAHGGIDIFTSIQRHNSYTIAKLSIRRAKICNFSRIGRKTEE